MALKSSYLLFYPKQPYFSQASWKGAIEPRFVSCYVIYKIICIIVISESVFRADIVLAAVRDS